MAEHSTAQEISRPMSPPRSRSCATDPATLKSERRVR